jgi:hypothetical protein
MDPKITADTDLGAELEMAMPPSVRHPNYAAGAASKGRPRK